MLALVGEGGYDLGARQGQIRDDLLAIEKATENDMLNVQLDDRALLLARWQKLLLATLTPDAMARTPAARRPDRLVEAWGGRASVDSVGYRIVRAFRERVRDARPRPAPRPARAKDPKLRLGTAPNSEVRGARCGRS